MNQSSRIIFDHIRKTGGQAVNQYLRANLGPYLVTPNLDGTHRSLISRYGGDFSIICGHIEFNAGGLDPRYQYATVLRNPIERVISWIFFTKEVLSETQPNSEVLSQIIDFLRTDGELLGDLIVNQINNHQTRHFQSCITDEAYIGDDSLDIARNVLQNYSLILKTENFIDNIHCIQDFFGFQETYPLTKENVNYKKPIKVSGNLLTRIHVLNKLDISLYDGVKSSKVVAISSKHTRYKRHYHDILISSSHPHPIQPSWIGNYSLRFYPSNLLVNKDNGIALEHKVISNGKKGILISGPFISLEPGDYYITATGLLNQGSFSFAVTKNLGNDIITESYISSVLKINILDKRFRTKNFFSLDKTSNDIEFKIFANDGLNLEVHCIYLVNLSSAKELSELDFNIIQSDFDSLVDIEPINIYPSDLYGTDIGKIVCGTIDSNCEEGIIFRKRCNLKAGNYKLYLFGDSNLSSLFKAYFIVHSNITYVKEKIISSIYFDEIHSRGMLAQPIKFFIPYDIYDVDMVLSVSVIAEFNIRNIYITKSQNQGVSQLDFKI